VASIVTPLGQNWIMTINQSGTKLTGRATDEFGNLRSPVASSTIR
jgi:hypothetical protein